MKTIMYCGAFAVSSLMNLANANASIVTISSQLYTGNAPVEGHAAPTSSTGSVSLDVTGSVPNVNLSPYAGNTNGTSGTAYNFISAGGSATYTVDSNFYSLLWGSPDSYNDIEFFSTTGNLLQTIAGNQLGCYSTVCQQTGFDLVSFLSSTEIGYVTLQDFNSQAFEFGTTPVPGAFLLFGSALGGLGLLAMRRRKHTLGSNFAAAA